MRYIILFLLTCIIIGCTFEKEIQAPQQELDYAIFPMDKKIFAMDSSQMLNSVNELYKSYPGFSKIYFNEILPLPPFNDEVQLNQSLKEFIYDKDIQWLKDTCQMIFSNLDFLKSDLDEAFNWYKFHFPERDIPDIYAFISAFQYQRFIFQDEKGKDAVGLGLDLFLGQDFPYQQMVPDNPNFSNFLSWTFDRKFIPKKIMELLVDDLMGDVKASRLLDYMIHNGIKWHILTKLLPNEDISVISELTEEQLKWCNENELEIWSFLLSEKLFYENNFMKINKLILPSPVPPPGMPKEAPGQTGNYMGWKIVQSFIKRNPDTSLKDLLKIEDSQAFLDQSRYKPTRR